MGSDVQYLAKASAVVLKQCWQDGRLCNKSPVEAAAIILAFRSACRLAWRLSRARASQGQHYQEWRGQHSLLVYSSNSSWSGTEGDSLLTHLPKQPEGSRSHTVLTDQKLTLSVTSVEWRGHRAPWLRHLNHPGQPLRWQCWLTSLRLRQSIFLMSEKLSSQGGVKHHVRVRNTDRLPTCIVPALYNKLRWGASSVPWKLAQTVRASELWTSGTSLCTCWNRVEIES